jgi:hypothetical protein
MQVHVWKENAFATVRNGSHKYSKSCNIWRLWDQRVSRCRNFPDIRMLYLMCTLVCLATSWTDLTFHLSLVILSCCTFYSLFITTYIMWCIYNLKKKIQQDTDISLLIIIFTISFWLIWLWIIQFWISQLLL